MHPVQRKHRHTLWNHNEGAPSWPPLRKRSSPVSPEIVNEIAGIPVEDVQLDKSFTDDLDVDSLSMVEVVVAAEERFDVKIPDDDVKNLKTVGDATDYILKHQA
ncbi:Acyl carrier protein [Streptomyces griseoloalbus]